MPPAPPILIPQDQVPKGLGSLDGLGDLSLGKLTRGLGEDRLGNLLGGMDDSNKLDLLGAIGDLDLHRFCMFFNI